MADDNANNPPRSKGQSERLENQHYLSAGPAGIFGEEAKLHDLSIRKVMEVINRKLTTEYTHLVFRHRPTITKKEINKKLSSVDPDLGQVLFVERASIKPDGGIIEVLDKNGDYRIVLVSESKHQGNDVEKIRAGIMQGTNKDQDTMVAGNAIERVHKNILEFRNFMIDEIYFPYVVFLQGSNFATNSFFVERPDGRKVKISHDAGNMNRIDRVTASSFGMPINQNYCRNTFVEIDGNRQMLQVASLYFQGDRWSPDEMATIMWDISMTSLGVLHDVLPNNKG